MKNLSQGGRSEPATDQIGGRQATHSAWNDQWEQDYVIISRNDVSVITTYVLQGTMMCLRQFVVRYHVNKIKSQLFTTAPSYGRDNGYWNRSFSQYYCVDHRRGKKKKKKVSESHGTAAYSNKLSRHCLKQAVFSVLNVCHKKGSRRRHHQHTKLPFQKFSSSHIS